MIVYDLQCKVGCAIFEAWFSSSKEFDAQLAGGLVECPFCGSLDIAKAPMAPLVARKSWSGPLAQIAALQNELLKDSRWVGEDFAETARAMHLGEIAHEQVHGSATLEQAKSLVDDGIPVAPLPIPVVPPPQVN